MKRNLSIISPNDEIDIYVYTDGACIHNGKPNAVASIGVYFADGDCRNISRKLPVESLQTNNVAELTAIWSAYETLAAEIHNNSRICIVTDSEYAIKCLTTYGDKCAAKLWEKEIPNRELVRKIYESLGPHENIKLMHINSHTGLKDIHSLGNEGADKMANMALGIETCPYANKGKECIFLIVPYKDKDYVKSLGGKWNPTEKKWYVYSDNMHIDELLEKYGK